MATTTELRTRARTLRNTATPAERALWQHLRASRLGGYKFSRQIIIGPFIADIVCRSRRLVIELDGGQHGDARDVARQAFIEAQGYRVLRFWNAQVLNDADMVVAMIADALDEIDIALISKLPTPDSSLKGGEKTS